ncbi:MAG: hypothetical protein VW362_09930, partial [Candidatus Nanopelagicales bacterium]
DGNALGEGVLIQGDDGTDRKNINVDPTTGDVQVDVTNTVTVDLGANNDVTLATLPDTSGGDLAAINTAVSLIDDSVFADDAAFTAGSSKVTMAGAIRDDSLSTLSAIEGDAVPLRVNSTGALHVTGGGGGTQYTIDDAGPTVVTMAGAIRDVTPGTLAEADGDATALRVDGSGALRTSETRRNWDVFGRSLVASPNNDIDIQFYKGEPSSLINVTTANSATAAANVGGALFSSSTNANGSVQGVTTQKTTYSSGSEIYCMFTAAFTAGIANSYMRIGLFDANEGFFLGYEGTTLGINYRNNGSDG